MTRRLHGATAAEMRQMCLDWYVAPLADRLLAGDATLQAVSFALHRPRPGAIGHRLFPEADGTSAPDAWWARVDAERATLLGEPGELDEISFGHAFASFCGDGPGPWRYAVVRPAAAAEVQRGSTVTVDVVGARVHPDPRDDITPPAAMAPEVAALWDGLGAVHGVRVLAVVLADLREQRLQPGDREAIARLREVIAAVSPDPADSADSD